MSAVEDKVVESLQEVGFSLYEARLYLGLLTGGPQNGNELSQTSGVPSSKVYAMLKRLSSEGIVVGARRGKMIEYVGIPPNELLHKLRESYTRPLDYLEEVLPTIVTGTPVPDVLYVQGEDAIIDHARAIIRSAEREIYLSLWEENVAAVIDELELASVRGVRIAGMLYGLTTPEFGWWQRHSYRDTVASRIGGRMLTMVSDGSEALIAHMPEHSEASAVRTKSPVLTLVAEEYLIHDLTLQKAKTMTGYEEWDRWLRADAELQRLTLGRTGHLSPIEPEVD